MLCCLSLSYYFSKHPGPVAVLAIFDEFNWEIEKQPWEVGPKVPIY